MTLDFKKDAFRIDHLLSLNMYEFQMLKFKRVGL